MRGLLTAWRSSAKVRVGLSIISTLALIALLSGPLTAWIGAGRNPLELGAYDAWEIPNPDHWLGTDRYGRDILAMTVTGLAASLQVGVIAGVLSTIFGVVVAFVAG